MGREMTRVIMKVRQKVRREEWRERILKCQSSGLPLRKWCEEKGVSHGSYYAHLRKLREETLEEHQFVPVGTAAPAGEILIEGGEIHVTLPGADPISNIGAEFMLKETALGTQAYLVTGYTDLWRGIDGLAGW